MPNTTNDYFNLTVEDYFSIREDVDIYFTSDSYRGKEDAYSKLSSDKKKEVDMCSDRVYNNACLTAPSITEDIKTLVSDNIGKLIPLDHTIKTKESLRRKIISDSVDYFGDYSTAADMLRDSVRYTIILDEDIYTQKVDEYLHKLQEMGYQSIEVKNNWNGLKCRGINSKIKSKDGKTFFELQFHTPMGYQVKEGSTRDLYQIIREMEADASLRERASKLRKLLQSKINIPQGALDYQYDSEIKSR